MLSCKYCGSPCEKDICLTCLPQGLTSSERKSRVRYLSKKKIIKLFGGKCALCGYCKYQSALEFHHMDDSTKKFNLSDKIYSYPPKQDVLDELKKCVLLCSNCHRAIHANEL